MSSNFDFSVLNIPVPDIVSTYDTKKQEEIYNYLKQMDEHHKKAYLIALYHLGSSFNIYRSNGFKEWLNKGN